MDKNEPIEVGFNATRVCEAIARIGYEPHSAIMDIIDNSVAAEASNIIVSLYLRPGKTLRTRNGVSKYSIVDDGKGMSSSELNNHLLKQVGSNNGLKVRIRVD